MAIRIRNGKEEEYIPKAVNYDVKVTIKMDKNRYEESKDFAKENKISLSELIRISTNEYIKNHKN